MSDEIIIASSPNIGEFMRHFSGDAEGALAAARWLADCAVAHESADWANADMDAHDVEHNAQARELGSGTIISTWKIPAEFIEAAPNERDSVMFLTDPTHTITMSCFEDEVFEALELAAQIVEGD